MRVAPSQVRRREGVEAPAGVDTLAAHLLAVLGNTAKLEELVTGSNAVSLAAVTPVLQEHGQWHALARLTAASGKVEDALAIWKVRTSLCCPAAVCYPTCRPVHSYDCSSPAALGIHINSRAWRMLPGSAI